MIALAEPAAGYLRWCEQKELSAGTIYGRRRALTRLAAQLPCPIDQADATMLAAWRAGMTRLTPAVVVNYVGMIRGFYLWLQEEGIRGDNPARRLPVPRKPRRLPRPITEADLRAAIAAAPPRIRPWLILAACAGLRAKEIALLRAENIVLDGGQQPAVFVAWDATKGTRERFVPLQPWAADELRACGLPSSGYAFRRLDGQRGPNKPHRISQASNAFLREAGILATLHQLRHRYATQLLRSSGGNLREVQEALGHASITSTTIYTLVETSSLAASVAALPVPAGDGAR
jgi:integrase